MSEYNIYPSVDEYLNFPPSLRAAIAAYPELADRYAPMASPTLDNATFTGTTKGLTASMVGLGNVNNTADTAKPVSTAMQTALNLKAPLANPTFTGTVKGVTAAMVGLGNVNNTADSAKPVSTAQQTEINKSALGLVSIQQMTTVTPSMDGVTVILNIPTFTFLAMRWYDIEFTGTVQSLDGQGRITAQLWTTPVGNAATSTSGLSEIGSYPVTPGATNFVNRFRANRKIRWTANTTTQIKATTSSSISHLVAAAGTYPVQLTITDLGIS